MPSRLSGLVWLGALAATAGITWIFHSETTEFRGVAEASETSVSSESAVEILALDVLPGQEVRVGDTLVRLRHPELAMRIADILHQIQGATGDASLTSAESRRRIGELKSEFATRKSELLGQIRALTDDAARNRSLLSGFGTLGATSDSGTERRIQEIRRQIQVEEAGVSSQVALLEGSRGDIARLASSQEAALRKELDLLHDEEARLVIRAAAPGVVGNVNFRPGEKVSPFSPILTVSGHNPTLVRGYVHELVRSDIALGDSVVVASTGIRSARVKGCVVGLGTRIVEFPLRLRKIPTIPMWGREVVVRIPSGNPLLLGEMVVVHGRQPLIRRKP